MTTRPPLAALLLAATALTGPLSPRAAQAREGQVQLDEISIESVLSQSRDGNAVSGIPGHTYTSFLTYCLSAELAPPGADAGWRDPLHRPERRQ